MSLPSDPLSVLRRRVAQALPGVAPGVRLRAYRQGELLCEVAEGEAARFYDLASVTKVVFTQQALMRAFDQGVWHLDSRVGDFLIGHVHGAVRLTELMTHTSGITWWTPFYETMPRDIDRMARWRWLADRLSESECLPDGRAVYSDLGIMLLGFVLETMHGTDLLSIWNRLRSQAYGRTTLAFHPDNLPAHDRAEYAPTEDCPWRGHRLQGEVHDDNTWALGGVSTHAGLFGSIDDLSAFGLMLRSQVLGLPGSAVRPEVAQAFARRAIDAAQGDWALGFMLPSASGASCGRYFSAQSIGHTGFTGTSIWFDPVHDLLVSICSNRVALGRENRAFIELRPKLHDWVCELFCPELPCLR